MLQHQELEEYIVRWVMIGTLRSLLLSQYHEGQYKS